MAATSNAKRGDSDRRRLGRKCRCGTKDGATVDVVDLVRSRSHPSEPCDRNDGKLCANRRRLHDVRQETFAVFFCCCCCEMLKHARTQFALRRSRSVRSQVQNTHIALVAGVCVRFLPSSYFGGLYLCMGCVCASSSVYTV